MKLILIHFKSNQKQTKLRKMAIYFVQVALLIHYRCQFLIPMESEQEPSGLHLLKAYLMNIDIQSLSQYPADI